jgi:hypothetical protein|nr:MAG TPA: WW domain protein [Crassvirales sp.]
MSGVKCIRLQVGKSKVKLKDVPIGIVVEWGDRLLMNILREQNKVYYYDFSKGETDWYGIMSAAANSEAQIIRGEITIKNPDVI